MRASPRPPSPIVKAGDITYSDFSPKAPSRRLAADISLLTQRYSQLGVTYDPTDSNCTPVKGVNTIDPSQIKLFLPGRGFCYRCFVSGEHLASILINKNPWVLSSASLQQQYFVNVKTVPPNSNFACR